MMTFLLEERANDIRSRNYCRKIVQRLHEQLEQYGIGDIIIRHNRGRSIDTSKVMCDYYEYLDGNESRKTEFCGEYMTNYSWGEDRVIGLLQMHNAEHLDQELRSGT
jgi:two-component SAPR family response regulator